MTDPDLKLKHKLLLTFQTSQQFTLLEKHIVAENIQPQQMIDVINFAKQIAVGLDAAS